MLSVHIHLNEKNIGFLGKDEFNQMKPNLILLNTSRGKIIDETALLEALQKKMIAGAGLDVVDGEWLSKKDLQRYPGGDGPNGLVKPSAACCCCRRR